MVTSCLKVSSGRGYEEKEKVMITVTERRGRRLNSLSK